METQSRTRRVSLPSPELQAPSRNRLGNECCSDGGLLIDARFVYGGKSFLSWGQTIKRTAAVQYKLRVESELV